MIALEVANRIVKYLSKNLNWYTLEDIKKKLDIKDEEKQIFEEVVEFLIKFNLIEYDRNTAKVRISRNIYNLMMRRKL
jgi:hypothetical protein